MARSCGVCCRGPQLDAIELRKDSDRLASWTLANLDEYWSPWIEQHSRLLSKPGLFSLRPGFTEWTALGVCRLHYTLAMGRITSKSGAGHYAKGAFPRRWHPVIEEARSCHAGGSLEYRNPFARRRDCLSFSRMVIADAKRLPVNRLSQNSQVSHGDEVARAAGLPG